MNYFIFGGSGFIGTHLINLIHTTQDDARIFNLDIVENNHGEKSQFIYCDVRKEIDLGIKNISENDIIFNLAAIHRTPGHPDLEYFETNIKGAENICAFADLYNINKIVFTSSIAPYGASEELKEETTLPMPNTPYGISKLVAEKTHQSWQIKKGGKSLLIVRPGVVFGKGENGNFTRLYWGLKKGRFFYPGRKDTIKAAIYVKDLVNFMLSEIKRMESSSDIFNCTYYPAYSIEEIINTMSEVIGIKAPKLKVNGKFLLFASSIVALLGGKKLGIHPDRVKKLMISTNISGGKLHNSNYNFQYTLKEAIKDWYSDNNNKCLQ